MGKYDLLLNYHFNHKEKILLVISSQAPKSTYTEIHEVQRVLVNNGKAGSKRTAGQRVRQRHTLHYEPSDADVLGQCRSKRESYKMLEETSTMCHSTWAKYCTYHVP